MPFKIVVDRKRGTGVESTILAAGRPVMRVHIDPRPPNWSASITTLGAPAWVGEDSVDGQDGATLLEAFQYARDQYQESSRKMPEKFPARDSAFWLQIETLMKAAGSFRAS